MTMRCVAVTGASGYIGSGFLRKFAEAVDIVPIARSRLAIEEHGRIPSLADLATALRAGTTAKPSALVHLVGQSRESSLNAIYDSNVSEIAKAVAFCEEFDIAPMVYVSGYGVFEESHSVYYRAKAAAERLLRSSGMAHVILQCSYIVGGNDELTPHILRATRSGVIEIPGDGDYRLQPVWLDDLLEILLAATHPSSLRGTFPVLGETVTMKEFVMRIAGRMRRRVTIMERDLPSLIRAAVLDSWPALSLSQIGILFSDKVGEPTPEVLGVPVQSLAKIVDLVCLTDNTF
jgi:uncharacterized protein YbjT (DUF2867 family)